ncbi:aat family amino acid transporter [Fusarium subglutinans]|uniref:Aat family amino acid transporter n=1 Tax=Gibberella subglutinans TaxID=42677 RepID=A0A8H5PRF6_GIBSU|nr:aat family amino acid transporter [Fusarium subglutinans]KAF5601710.1 aat family amino acid transporter [Fusarium subglutinans]
MTILRPSFSELRHLPGPTNHHFLVGHALRILRGSGPNELYLQWMRRWPNAPFIRCLSWLNSEVLLVNNIEACHEVLQTNAYRFAKPGFFHTLVGEFLGVGPLSRPSIRKLFPTFVSYSRKLNSDIEAAIQQSSNGVLESSYTPSEFTSLSRADNAILVDDLFTRVTLDIIGVSLVGKELRDFSSKTSPLSFEQCYNGILAQPLAGQIISFINPFIPLRWLPVSANLNFIKAKSALKGMMTELIEQRTSEVAKAKELGTDSGLSDDLLTRMIEASSVENQKLSRDELIDITMQVIAAGHETTASALLWTTYALSKVEKSQERLRTEILTLSADDMTAKSIDELPYLDNVIREALRVYSPTLMIPWEALEDIEIAGVSIPKGTTVQLVPAMTQLNPEIWGPDVEAFNPDRWERLSGDALSPYAMETFSNGPRMCPGKSLALLNMKVLLVGLIRDFKIESIGDHEVEFRNPSLTLKSKRPLRFKVQRAAEGA